MAEYDRRAVRFIAVAFAALAGYVWIQAGYDLASGARPDASVPGMIMALLSFLVMPRLARAKRALAPALGSQAVAADADQTNLCALLSGVLLAAAAARRAWSAESLADTCCP
jgi:divalent metal cation (Fe/Co/Zn/Cd) transporter